jgi:CotH kinase protein
VKAVRLLWVGLAFVAVAGPWAQQARADEAATLYDPSRMYVVKLSLPPASKQALETPATWMEYQPGTFSVAVSADGTPDGVGAFSTPVNVGIRLKGNYSFRTLAGKAAFKVKFGKTELFHGLRVLTLNSMVGDPSMVRETLAYEAFRSASVPASRTGYAYVYVDGVDYGVHLNVETVDKIALEKLLGPFDEEVQHLYEGEDADDVSPGQAEDFEVDEGDEEDLSDLEALIEATNSSGPQSWAERVAATADLQEMTKMWAVEKYTGQWDGYAGQEESWTPNNYYLYSDTNGVFKMLPWGLDETWQTAHRLRFDGPAGLMFDRCLADSACSALYRQAVVDARDVIAGVDLDALAVQSAALLAPWQEMEDEESTRGEWGLKEIADGVAEVRAFVAARPGEAAKWLNGEVGGEEQEAQGSAGPPPPAAPSSSSPGVRMGKARVTRGGILRTRVHLPAAGTVVQRGKVSTGEGARVVCLDRVKAERPRSVTLRCPLPASIRERLRSGPVSITLAIRFIPMGGRPENLSRWLVLPRT